MEKNKYKKYLFMFFAFSTLLLQAQTQIGANIQGEAAGDLFGVAINMPDDKTIAIGSVFNDKAGIDAGLVRIYNWNGSSWVQQGNDFIGESAGDCTGSSVSMPNATTVAIGSGGSNHSRGHVKVYHWDGTAWIQRGTGIFGESVGDWLGIKVAMPDLNTLAIGANGYNGSTGFVTINVWDGANWIQRGSTIYGDAPGDLLGIALSMPNANTLAIAAPFSSNTAGYVRVYNWNGKDWLQKGVDIVGESPGDKLGFGLSMPDENTLSVGAYGKNNGTGDVRIYSWNGNSWIQKGATLTGEIEGEQFGWSVNMPQKNMIAIGAPLKNNSTGQVNVYFWNGSKWVKVGTNLTGSKPFDRTGFIVNMPDANTLAVGSPNLNTSSETGYAQVFSFSGLVVFPKEIEKNIQIFPNPASQYIQIKADLQYIGLNYTMYDISGKIVLNGKLNYDKTTVNLSDFASGVYLLNFYGNENKTFKIIKN